MKTQWTEEQDKQLLELVAMRGHAWRKISSFFLKSDDAVRNRYWRLVGKSKKSQKASSKHSALKNNSKWMPAEDERLLGCVAQHFSWSQICEILSRAPNAARNRYRRITYKHVLPDDMLYLDDLPTSINVLLDDLIHSLPE